MIDGHIHIHRQPYSLELISNMVSIALEKEIDELYILDHTHKFKELNFLYASVKGSYSKEFFNRKLETQVSIFDYISFIKEVKKQSWPIKLNFGLEVCYFNEHQKEFEDYISSLPFKFDFLIGSIHFVDGMCIDLCKEIFLENDVDTIYKHYFLEMERMIKTKFYDVIAHPDCIKLFNFYPSFSLIPYYESLAKTLKEYQQRTENNSGLVRYGYPEAGLNKELLEIFKKYDVKFHRSSDAHVYTDIGRVFDLLEENL